jgi:hypothetical protein
MDNNYDTAKLLVTSFVDAIPRETLSELLPSHIDLTNYKAVKKALRLLVVTKLLSSRYNIYFVDLTAKQVASLLGITVHECTETYYSTIQTLASDPDPELISYLTSLL